MAAAKGARVGPDSTQIMLQKNDRIREKHVKQLSKLGKEAERCTEERSKQIFDLQKEIKDLHAFSAVYKNNSLVMIDSRRRIPSYNDILLNQERINQEKRQQGSQLQHATARLASSMSKKRAKTAGSTARDDPFHLRNCLIDVELEKLSEGNKPPPPIAEDLPKISTRKRLKRSKTAKTVNSEYESLLPGNCTSYYSIRKYYEQEKDKLLYKWSPQERRKRTVRWILDNITVPQFSVMRQTRTSAIFREFRTYRESPVKTTRNSDRHVTLPAIQSSKQQDEEESESAYDEQTNDNQINGSENGEDNSPIEDNHEPDTEEEMEHQLEKVSLQQTVSDSDTL